MGLTIEQIDSALDSFTEWLSNPNIVGLYVGTKTVNDKETEDLAIIVDVIQKKTPEALTEDDIRIPSYIEIKVPTFKAGSLTYRTEKIPTDVVEVGEIIDEDELFTDVEETPPETIEDDTQKVRPCPGGLFIQTEGLHVRGTLGVNTVYKGGYRLISNNHVISKNGSVGQMIHQPTPPRPGRELVEVTGFISIQYYSNPNQPNPVFNINDVAWADANQSQCSSSIQDIGTPAGFDQPRVGETVKKRGAKTASVLSAKIRSVNYRYRSRNRSANLYSWWKNGILLDRYISAPGDSGAAYLSNDLKIVGLHRSGSSRNNRSIGAPL